MASSIILITGANSGVGFAATKVIASAAEYFHVIMACRSLEKGKAAMSEIGSAGIKGNLSVLQLDVTDEKSVEQAVKDVDQKFGRLDVLVNNAGVGNRDPNVKVRMQACMDVNVIGPAVVAAAFRPLLLKSQKPYSIYISSGVGSMTLAANRPHNAYANISNGEAYGASKAALNFIALYESKEFASTPLKTFVLDPGFVRSNLRGETEEERSGWGKAGDPARSGRTILSIIQGERDADVGKFLQNDGLYPW